MIQMEANRELLDPNFEAYKLGLSADEPKEFRLSRPLYRPLLPPTAHVTYSQIQARTFYNHFFADDLDANGGYFINDLQVMCARLVLVCG